MEEREEPVGVAADELTSAESQRGHLWLRRNILTSYLTYRFPGVPLVASHGGIYTSEHFPIKEQETIATMCEIVSFETPEHAWAELLLEMCDAVAAGQQEAVPITCVQAQSFLSLAQKIDDRWISY